MSNEMLPGKLSANQAVSAESPPIVIEKKKRGEGGRLLLFLIVVGLGAVMLTSITVLAPVTFYGHVASPGSISDSGNGNRGNGAAAIPTTALASSATATDGKGTLIEDNGVTKSRTMTITGYSDSSYNTKLQCSIDSLPLYCSGSPVTLSELPAGEHTFAIIEPSSGETIVRAFSWTIS
jgi:hypothetical protein